MSDFRTRIPCREIASLSKLYDVLTNEYGNMYYKLETEKNEQGELFWVVGVSSHFARDVRELLITKGVLRHPARSRGFTAIKVSKSQENSLPEVIDLTRDDPDEETLQVLESPGTANTSRNLTSGPRQYLPETEKIKAHIDKSVANKRDNPKKTQQKAVTQTPNHHGRAEQGPVATCNSAVGQGDRSTGRIPIYMLLGDAHTQA
ncbi:uncharacterized protein FFB14_10156 [Fusarium fujikuroi]|nr:uncharacterized protein FFB14_10156 [Fusarium fujikuroi]